MSERKLTDQKDVLDILAKPFKPGERVMIYNCPATIVCYYKNGEYQIKFDEGWYDGINILYHMDDIEPLGAERNT